MNSRISVHLRSGDLDVNDPMNVAAALRLFSKDMVAYCRMRWEDEVAAEIAAEIATQKLLEPPPGRPTSPVPPPILPPTPPPAADEAVDQPVRSKKKRIRPPDAIFERLRQNEAAALKRDELM
jgi:hypothetical protein